MEDAGEMRVEGRKKSRVVRGCGGPSEAADRHSDCGSSDCQGRVLSFHRGRDKQQAERTKGRRGGKGHDKPQAANGGLCFHTWGEGEQKEGELKSS